MQNHTASLFAKPTPLNIDLSSDRFSMFNKERDIPSRHSVICHHADCTQSYESHCGEFRMFQ